MVFCPETLMKQVLSHTHYIPDAWKGRAHTKEVSCCLHLLKERVQTKVVASFQVTH